MTAAVGLTADTGKEKEVVVRVPVVARPLIIEPLVAVKDCVVWEDESWELVVRDLLVRGETTVGFIDVWLGDEMLTAVVGANELTPFCGNTPADPIGAAVVITTS